MKRLFIGIPLPVDFSKELIAFQEANQVIKGIQWTPERNLHITLCFIGDYDENKIDLLVTEIDRLLKSFPPFVMEFEHFQFGPNYKKAYMLWATFKENKNFTQLLYKLNMEILRNQNTKKVIPHITLCRFKFIQKNEVTLDFPCEVDTIHVTKIILYESLLKKTGAEYKTVKEFNLSNA